MIDTELYDYIYDNFTLTDITNDGFIQFYYGSGEASSGSYGVMLKINDEERPETLCKEQGDTGRALFQFSFWSGGNTGESTNAHEVLQLCEDFKNQFKVVRGEIGSIPNKYRIENNITNGARLLGGGSQDLLIWGAFFEADIWWTKL